MTLRIDPARVEDAAKELYIRALKMLPPDVKRGFDTLVARETDQTAQRIRFDALKAYYGVLLAQMKKEVADEAVKLAEADVKRSGDRVEVGAAVSSDLMRPCDRYRF